MKCDIILSGVGGQGVLSLAGLIGYGAIAEGLHAKQSEVHGMAQRGGAVQAHLRLADRPIHSDLIPRGAADMILSMEPLESLRYLDYLSPAGTLVTATNPFVNIPDYPALEGVLARIRELPHAILVDAESLAREAGEVQAMNTVMVGAASHLLPLKPETLEKVVRQVFGPMGERMVEVNLAAFRAGRKAGETVGAR
ncbi:MAG TPA: indolepyruvate oxidoreductase subunit beta [Candidatus Saccharimonadales bacterium]|nr:indolepyruvate oxidoreductase subunit beta [Candidatus Saccharimonadales bacterium]